MQDRGGADLVEDLRGAPRVVEAHADLARRAPTHAVRERHDVMVEHHEAMLRCLELRLRRHLAQPRQLRGPDRPVVAEEPALRAGARVEPDEHRIRLGHVADPAARLVELEPDARRERRPRRALRVRRGTRAAAAPQRKEIEVVVTGNDEEPALVLPAREGGLDELPARAVVGDVAGDDHRVRIALLDPVHRPQEAHVRVARRSVEEDLERALRGDVLGERPGAARLEVESLGGRAFDGIEHAAAFLQRRNGVRVAVGVDQRDLRGALALLVEDAPARLLPDDLEARGVRRHDVRAALHDAQAVVERVAELGDVEVRDVSDGELHPVTCRRGS